MAYLKIPNLYKDQTILMFQECYAMEKIHGTSAHISYKPLVEHRKTDKKHLTFFSGGVKYENFVKLFNEAKLNNETI